MALAVALVKLSDQPLSISVDFTHFGNNITILAAAV